MMPQTMRDLLVLVPGILGTELKKNGNIVWGMPEGLSNYLRPLETLADWVKTLRMGKDHGDPFETLNGIEPSRLIDVPQVVSRFMKADGYDSLRNFLHKKFRLRRGQDQPDNYLEFPYDWRRDCRINAVRLHSEIESKLAQLRSLNRDAHAIFICHSMGGLITKYCLDQLSGWQDCKALITLGTPYKGSLNSVDSISNGFDLFGVQFDDALRSFEGVYQLMPTYGVIDTNEDDYLRVDHPDANVPGLDIARATDAIDNFQGTMNQVRRAETERIFAFVGDNQDTLQSAQIKEDRLSPSTWTHHDWPAHKQTGDGTVPVESSVPPEFQNDPRGVYRAGSAHALLQSDTEVQRQIFRILAMLQDRAITPIQAEGTREKSRSKEPTCKLVLENVYEQRNEIEIQLITDRINLDKAILNAKITSYDNHNFHQSINQMDDGWTVKAKNLQPGIYKIIAQVFSYEQEVPLATQDIFEVRT